MPPTFSPMPRCHHHAAMPRRAHAQHMPSRLRAALCAVDVTRDILCNTPATTSFSYTIDAHIYGAFPKTRRIITQHVIIATTPYRNTLRLPRILRDDAERSCRETRRRHQMSRHAHNSSSHCLLFVVRQHVTLFIPCRAITTRALLSRPHKHWLARRCVTHDYA